MAQEKPSKFDEKINLKEAARFLGIAESTARRWAWEGKIPVYKVSSRCVCSLRELEDFLKIRKREK